MAGLGDLQYRPQIQSEDEPTYRMSMLPFGTYANPDGTEHLGFALPGMIHEPLMAAQRLFGTPSQPGNFGQGPDAPGNADDMRTLLNTFYAGNALNPARAAEATAMHDLPLYFSGDRTPGGSANFGAYHGPYQVGNAYTRDLGDVAQVGNIHVDPDYQGQGLGFGLMNYAADQMGKPLIPDTTFTTPGFALAKKYFGDGALQNYRKMGEDTYMQDAGGMLPNVANDTGISMDDLISALRQRGMLHEPQYADGGTVADMPALPALPDYGFGPMTQTTIAGYPNGFISNPGPTWQDKALDAAEAPAKGLVGQFNTATDQIANAMADPSIPNITGAGYNTAMLLGRPAAAGLALAGGIGALGTKQFLPGLLGFGAGASADAGEAPIPGLTPAQMQHYTANQRVIRRIGDKDDPRVMQAMQENQTLQGISADYVRTQNQADLRAKNAASDAAAQKTLNDEALRKQIEDQKQQEYNSAVTRAESARDAELGRVKRFSTWDSPWKNLYENIGGEAAAPFSTGVAEGALSRMALGPGTSIPGKIMKDWVIPMVTGGLSGYAVSNVPDAYNYQANDPDNPFKAAAEVYARELPPTHPRKQEALDYAASLANQNTNPVRDAAMDDYYGHMGERAVIGGTEGLAGGKFGNLAASVLGRLGTGIKNAAVGTADDVAPLALRADPRLPLLSEVSPVPSEAASKLRAGSLEAAEASSGPGGPVSAQPLLVRPDASDIAPAVAPKKTPASGRRNKLAGSKGSAKPETILPAPASDTSPSPDTQSAAADEVKRFLGKGPDPLFAAGGAVDGRPELPSLDRVHSGPLHSQLGGRTDSLPVSVEAGSYILPADIVSALGEGNSEGGHKVIEHMFGRSPPAARSRGGVVPIMAAGGEHALNPDQVRSIGGGDLNMGHQVLDAFVKHTRNEAVNTLKKLPSPAQ